MKKNAGDIIILHMCTKNHFHMMYGFWDTEPDRQNFLSFWTIFCPFTLLTTRKIKILKKWKNTWRYHHFTLVWQKSWSYAALFLRSNTWRMSFSFYILGYFLPLCPEISSFYTCVPKIMITWCTVAEIWCATNGQTNGRKKWHIEVGAPPKKFTILEITLWNFAIFLKSFHSPQVKQYLISNLKRIVYELFYELPNNLRLKILGNLERIRSGQN